MPKVGKKRFPYNSRGIAAAQAESKATGEEMEVGEGVNVARDNALTKQGGGGDEKKKESKKKPAKKSAKKGNPFAKKGGY